MKQSTAELKRFKGWIFGRASAILDLTGSEVRGLHHSADQCVCIQRSSATFNNPRPS